jgi:hypothetical protein
VTSARVKQPTEADRPAGIRERGALDAALLTVRAAAGQVVAFGGTLVLAHLFSPTAFGLVAFGGPRGGPSFRKRSRYNLRSRPRSARRSSGGRAGRS